MARYRADDRGEHRTAALKVQLTPTERAELDRRAAASGLTLSEFARIVLLSDLKAPAPPARDPEAIAAVTFQLQKIGTNVNQMAKIANERRVLPLEREFREVSERIVTALDRLMLA
jgi:hypothetical protein